MRSLALEPMVPEMEKQLAELQKDPKLAADKKADRLKALRKTIAETRARDWRRPRLSGGLTKTFTLHDGEALANPDTPPQSFYELTANANLPQLSAIRIEVPPLNAEIARHTPENGFIVDKVEGWVISPGGQKSQISFRYFVQDSERNLQAALLPQPTQRKWTIEPDPDLRAPLPPCPSSSARAGSSASWPSRCHCRRAPASSSI